MKSLGAKDSFPDFTASGPRLQGPIVQRHLEGIAQEALAFFQLLELRAEELWREPRGRGDREPLIHDLYKCLGMAVSHRGPVIRAFVCMGSWRR